MSAERHLQPVPDQGPPPLVVVNTETGERMGPLTQFTEQAEAEYSTLEGKYRGALAEITKLKRDKEADARAHAFWLELATLHDWYAIATGHPGRKFGTDEFYQGLPRLKAGSPIEFLHGIAGIAYDPKRSSRPQRNGKYTLYDSWEHFTRNPGNFQSYVDRAPFPDDEHAWKRWLISHVEAQLVESDRDRKTNAKG